jgi:hypothetical protein
VINYFYINLSRNFVIELISIKLCGCRDLMIFGFTTTYEISAYHHSSFDFESKLSKLYLIHCVVKFVSDLIHYVVKFVSDLIHYVVKVCQGLDTSCGKVCQWLDTLCDKVYQWLDTSCDKVCQWLDTLCGKVC